MDAVMNASTTLFTELGTNLGTLFVSLLGLAAGFGLFYLVKSAARRGGK